MGHVIQDIVAALVNVYQDVLINVQHQEQNNVMVWDIRYVLI